MDKHQVEYRIHARTIKVTLVLDAGEIAKLQPPPDGVPRTTLHISVAGHNAVADLAAKSLRKVIAAVRENPENFAVILQGKLGPKDEILEAGLSSQPRTIKPSAEA